MTAPASGRVLTVPNAISLVRLLGVPLFLYLFLVGAYGWAVAVLAVGGTSDWVDGFLARRLHQVSRLGELLDPFADRLYILATLIAFTVGGVVPWLFTAALLLREVVLTGCLAVVRRYGYGPLPVHYVGKTATFILLAGFPVLLLARASAAAAPVAGPIGWALAWWGLALYWAAGVMYVLQTVRLVRGRSEKEPASA
jgi:cardiolipin synthase